MAASMRPWGQWNPKPASGRDSVCALFVLLLNEGGKGVDILLQHLLHRLAGKLALVVEGGADSVEVDFRLAHDHAGNARHDVLQMLGGADAAGRARRIGDNARRLAEETALAIGP